MFKLSQATVNWILKQSGHDIFHDYYWILKQSGHEWVVVYKIFGLSLLVKSKSFIFLIHNEIRDKTCLIMFNETLCRLWHLQVSPKKMFA